MCHNWLQLATEKKVNQEQPKLTSVEIVVYGTSSLSNSHPFWHGILGQLGSGLVTLSANNCVKFTAYIEQRLCPLILLVSKGIPSDSLYRKKSEREGKRRIKQTKFHWMKLFIYFMWFIIITDYSQNQRNNFLRIQRVGMM